MNLLAPTVGLAVVGLAALVTVELGPRPAATIDTVPPTRQVSPLAPSAPSQSNEAETAARVDTLLSRPLFSQTRRAPTVANPASVTPSPATPLPRMTGILIDGPRRLAIFAAQTGIAGSKPRVIAEGGLIGAFTVKTIGPQQVTVTGPGGERTVHTGFDPNLQPPPVPAPTPVAYNFDAPKILNVAPGPSLLSRSLPSVRQAAPDTAFRLPQAARPAQ